jgi:hypothetical protein
MVATESRRRAALLTEQFRDGKISNFDFEESWPRCDRRDRALRAIGTMLWRFYSDGHEHTLVEEGYVLSPEGREIFDRCALFLRTDLEYQWPKENFIGVGGLGVLGRILTLGLSVFIDRAWRRREERRLTAMAVIGEKAAWPFLTTDEYSLHQNPRSQ